MMIRKSLAAALAATTLLTAAACSSDDKKDAGTSSSASKSTEKKSDSSSSESASESSSSAPTSEAPKDANGREILPSTEPTGFSAHDLSKPFKYGYIVNYVNKYPGWIVLSTEEPKYDAALGGYRVNVYFSANGGSDIILRDEFTMVVDGKTYQAEPLQPTGSGGTTDFLADKTPIGNRPDATKNYAFGDIVFKMPQTQSALEMKYDNKDGDVHITWSPNATD